VRSHFAGDRCEAALAMVGAPKTSILVPTVGGGGTFTPFVGRQSLYPG
jgi:hypothetical protein